jgi:hypothetical protein
MDKTIYTHAEVRLVSEHNSDIDTQRLCKDWFALYDRNDELNHTIVKIEAELTHLHTAIEGARDALKKNMEVQYSASDSTSSLGLQHQAAANTYGKALDILNKHLGGKK